VSSLSPQFWVIFDAVGTLIEPTPSVAEAYWSIGQQFGTQLSVEEVRVRFKRAFVKKFSGIDDEHRSSEKIELVRWRQIVDAVFDDVDDQDGCFEQVHEHFSKPEAWTVFDDVAPVLKKLKEVGVGVAIGSNFDQRLHDVCDGHPELRWVDVAFASANVGYRKPSLKFYEQLAVELDMDCSRMLMVGDHLENDVIAARKAGLHAILIERQANEQREASAIHSLRELPAKLEAIFKNGRFN